ncbi:hypothetical protein U3516DRAFT_767734 [Neocallimastix sp. 'constans']
MGYQMNSLMIFDGELINLVIMKNENDVENNVVNRIEDISMNNKINIENIDGEELIYTIS